MDSVKQSIAEEVGEGTSVEKGKRFLKWVVTRLFDASEDDFENQYLDGAQDLGIDYWLKIDGDEGGIMQLFQVKYGTSHKDEEILKFKNDVKKFLKMEPKEIIRQDVKDVLKTILQEELEVELIYVTNSNVEFKSAAKLKVYGFQQIVDKLWSDIVGLPKGEVKNLKLDQSTLYNNTILGVVSLVELASFVNSTKSYIFESNIRKFLHKTKVNKDLRETIRDDPSSIFYYNNGITIVVKKFRDLGNDTIELHEPQIVNGAQTASTIAQELADDPKVKGSIQVTIITETSKTTREDITRYRNSQNAVKGKDLISLQVFHTRIRAQLRNFRYYYEQQAGAWLNMPKPDKEFYKGDPTYNKYLPDRHDCRIIAKDAIQAMVAGITQNPTKPYGSISRYMPGGSNYADVFNNQLKDDYRLFLYPYLIKSYCEKEFGYGKQDVDRPEMKYARLLFVTAYFRILRQFILKKDDMDDIKKDPSILEQYFKDFETNKKLLNFTHQMLKYYFGVAKKYVKEHDITTLHNFFAKAAWDETLQDDFINFVNVNIHELKEIKQSFKK